MAQIDFGGTVEEVITSDEFPIEKAREILKDETITISNNPDMASYIHKIDMSFTMDGKPMQMKDTRVTGVLKKTKSGWRHVQAHWSIGIQGQAIEY